MARKRPRDTVHGVLVVDKPEGCTSFDVVRQVRRRLGVRKVGHTGTLDPMATGVLALCIGDATRIASLLTAADKGYWARGRLGIETDTLDTTGTVLREAAVEVTREQLVAALDAFRGPIKQTPPAFSALHVNGQRAHELARAGKAVDLAPRDVNVERLELRSFEAPEFEIVVECSKGTYVRSLIADIGRALGCGAAMSGLRRVRSGAFSLEQAVAVDNAGLDDLRSIDQALQELPAVELAEQQVESLLQGRALDVQGPSAAVVRARLGGQTLAIGRVEGRRFHPKRVFVGAIEALGRGQPTQ